jgi:hypothetical protein
VITCSARFEFNRYSRQWNSWNFSSPSVAAGIGRSGDSGGGGETPANAIRAFMSFLSRARMGVNLAVWPGTDLSAAYARVLARRPAPVTAR